MVEGDLIKDNLSELITLTWDEKMEIDQPEGFMNFPFPDNGKYTYKSFFHEFEGEKREIELNAMGTSIGSRWMKKHSTSANHYWDCRVYAHVVRDIIVEKFCKAAKTPVSWKNFAKLFN